MSRVVQIKCKGSDEFDIEELLDFQGGLKEFKEENYQKLKAELLDLGFSEPISIWIDELGKKWILNGHSRRKTLIRMKLEGYEIPLIPVSVVEADDRKQAKKKVLSLTSAFGTMTQKGLADFCELNEFKVEDIMKEFVFPEIPKLETPRIAKTEKDVPIGKDIEYFLEIECESKDDQTIHHELLLSQGYKIKSITIDTKKKNK